MVLMLHSKIMFSADERSNLLVLPGFTDFGYYGVQLFFVISGFIIAHVVNRQSFDWRTFAVKRCVRIYPLWWVVMSLGLGLYFWRSWWRSDFESLGWLGVVKSFALWPQKPWPFINPGWSLEYELIFYAIVAAALPWIRLWGVVLVLITLALTASAFRAEYGFHLVDSSYLFFAAGIIAYLLRSRSWCEAAPLAVVCLSLAYARFYEAVPMALSEAMLALAIGLASLLVTVVSLERNGWKVPHAASTGHRNT
jgi:peptidoglycan/LPS O-acetylase OafA/YrhL